MVAAPLSPLPARSGAYTEARAADVIRQAADAVAFLHSQGLCHADIKPENLLLTSDAADAPVKLVDFGLTTEVRNVSASKPGTWAYWPPEAFGDGVIGTATDMWSLGVVLFVLLAGYHVRGRSHALISALRRVVRL